MGYFVKKPEKKQSIQAANAAGLVTFEKFYAIVEEKYWIVDPLHFTIEFYENQDGEWVEIKPDEHGRLHSKVQPGFWLKAKWFTSAQPLSPVAPALEEVFDS